MNANEWRELAKQHTTTCHLCKDCNGVACRGEIPGLGGKGSGNSFIRNVEQLKKVRVKLDTIMQDGPIDTTFNWLGQEFSMPVFGAPIAGTGPQYGSDVTELQFAQRMLKGAQMAGTISFVGDGKDLNMFTSCSTAVKEIGGMGICTMKPWERKGVDIRLAMVKDSNILALASDVDASGLLFLRNADPRITNFSIDDMRYVKEQANKPFIVKGIMTVAGAQKALAAGADAIVVSNHGGRVLDDCEATIEVLPAIKEAVGDAMTILIDGGFRSGVDVFKALALGADAVLIGRPVALCAVVAGEEAVCDYYKKIQLELKETMMMTGCHTLADITADKVKVTK